MADIFYGNKNLGCAALECPGCYKSNKLALIHVFHKFSVSGIPLCKKSDKFIAVCPCCAKAFEVDITPAQLKKRRIEKGLFVFYESELKP